MTVTTDLRLIELPEIDSGHEVRPALFRSRSAPIRRTLLDILDATVRDHGDAPAIDAGVSPLTYRELADEVEELRETLAGHGVGVGDRVGVRISSGSADLYLAILGVLAAGAAYVPVDADDPEERAELVFAEAGVCAVLGDGLTVSMRRTPEGRPGRPGPADDAWIIFTSGSTGTPKGVAVSHGSAAAFVDAEAQLFLTEEPIGPQDRVLAGLSVAFDASCEEMWLAWRHGACLVPAARSLVRSGVDLGPWLAEQRITVVSTVPTLAALWPVEALEDVRLLIFGGEACPPELGERLAVEGREVWNTYGPTEATVVACAARLTGEGPVRIGLPLAGWELAVVGPDGEPVAMGETGELVIGGVGLARYLDAAKDAEKFAALASLGWQRAYRSGDIVRAEPEGLLFLGRGDEQVKLGGRRIELGEVDAALQALPGVAGAAAAVKRTAAGNQLLVGYLVPHEGAGFDVAAATERIREQLPAALVPLLAVVDALPTRTSGKVDRAALPWPLVRADGSETELTAAQEWLAGGWEEILGVRPGDPGADFFSSGGSSLNAAQLVAWIRRTHPRVSVADVYQNPRLSQMVAVIEALDAEATVRRDVRPTPRRAGLIQALLMLPMLVLVGLRWVVVLAAASNLLTWAPHVSWWWIAAGWAVLFSPAGRIAVAAAGARLLLRGVGPGDYPRGGGVHLRIWAAERLAELTGANGVAGAGWMITYAKALGAKIGRDVDLHSAPPVTGLLKLGRGAAVEPEADLSGYWVDGDLVRVGMVRIGAGARIGSRSTLMPGARVGKGAKIAAGSTVTGAVPSGRRWAGSPAVPAATKDAEGWPAQRPARSPLGRGFWVGAYSLTAQLLGLLPVLAALPALALLGAAVADGPALGAALLAVPAAAISYVLAYAMLVLIAVRTLGIGMKEGFHPVQGRVAWQVWTTERLMGMARVALFPMYSSLFTPVWLRLLGAKVGRNVEASTVLALPAMTTVDDGAFLADDTMVATYELSHGWLRVAPARIGKQAFLGNSGMAAPGRSVPKRGLVGVLSSAPHKAKKGSSWLGAPPMPLRRTVESGDASRTFAPPLPLKLARAAIELCRIVPVMLAGALAVLVLASLGWIWQAAGGWAAALAAGPVLLAAAIAAGLTATAAKWLLIGRFRVSERALWTSFVWRNELADTFVEVLATPWLFRFATGTPLLTMWLRTLGARIGRGVWLETHWLPEYDLVSLGAGATVNRGCVVQTHLFHDRIMAMDEVTLGAGATLGPHGIVLPGASIGARTTVGPGSLVTRGDAVPDDSRWLGNPIATWPSSAPRRR
ncbi:putative NRPS-related enzyme [Actinoplanes missouriensis 431]|uniref:Putative NRPS-related enzyme n=1 Tax=Actinoplanes missouriensis (strain ATCC 14538 / DSM 43046 / CBS 188.64 / JCM 3121 / NBRC 102363 / NCIMB 12654 / NRRL B-3342 / UNCC 431) TaxID=512565 RepID=I0HDZ5_ACTM4|nr:Pls/PosA family non-ribosomal peptide synthetase [Actinoplanes missouriensis]BAL91232.1 putative NRPS-related enzyme [Actinoplanes missouriensis 431]